MRESISRIFGVTEKNDLEIHSTDEVKAIPLDTDHSQSISTEKCF